MVHAASSSAHNPVQRVAAVAGLSHRVAPRLALPLKLVSPPLVLGLGDMTVPGLVLALAFRTDRAARNGCAGLHALRIAPTSCFLASLAGYALGLLAALVGTLVYHRAQPALLYIVPSVLASLFLYGWTSGMLAPLIHGERIQSLTIY